MFQNWSNGGVPPATPQASAELFLWQILNPHFFESLGRVLSAIQAPADHPVNTKAAKLLESVLDVTQGHFDKAVETLTTKSEG